MFLLLSVVLNINPNDQAKENNVEDKVIDSPPSYYSKLNYENSVYNDCSIKKEDCKEESFLMRLKRFFCCNSKKAAENKAYKVELKRRISVPIEGTLSKITMLKPIRSFNEDSNVKKYINEIVGRGENKDHYWDKIYEKMSNQTISPDTNKKINTYEDAENTNEIKTTEIPTENLCAQNLLVDNRSSNRIIAVNEERVSINNVSGVTYETLQREIIGEDSIQKNDNNISLEEMRKNGLPTVVKIESYEDIFHLNFFYGDQPEVIV